MVLEAEVAVDVRWSIPEDAGILLKDRVRLTGQRCQNRRPAPTRGITLQAGNQPQDRHELGITLPPLVLTQADHVIE